MAVHVPLRVVTNKNFFNLHLHMLSSFFVYVMIYM